MKVFKETCRPINSILKNPNQGQARPAGRIRFKTNRLKLHGVVNSLFLDKKDHTDVQAHDHPETKYQLQGFRNVVFRKTHEHDIQWGYIKFDEKQETKADNTEEYLSNEKAILFVNNTNLQTIAGEEDRPIYYDIKNVDLRLDDSTTVTIHVALNFDYVRKNPSFPKSHKNDNKVNYLGHV